MRFLAILATLTFLLLPAAARAQTQQEPLAETNFVITVKAKDAKFIGTAVGGAMVVVRDRRSGDILIQGRTLGGTGDTKKIMESGYARDAVLVDDKTAKFQFTLELTEPTPVTISATGPLDQHQAAATVSEDMILIPAKDYTTGNGIMLELPGMAVDVTEPPVNSMIKLDPEKPVKLTASVQKMCGCPATPGTPWDPKRYDVEVRIYKDDLYIMTATLEYAGTPGIYSQNVKIPVPGIYRLVVTAFDRETKEAGMDGTSFTLTQ